MFRVWSPALQCALLFATQAYATQTLVQVEDGEVAIHWASTSSFRFCRAWPGQKCEAKPAGASNIIQVKQSFSSTEALLSTEYLTLVVQRKDGLIRVLNAKGEELMAEVSVTRSSDGEIRVVRKAEPGEGFYGLGPRAERQADARGMRIASLRPFLYSTKGYGLHHLSPGNYVFDLGASDTQYYAVTIRPAQRLEYWFYYGPTFKGVLEEHSLVSPVNGVMEFGVLDRRRLPPQATLLDPPQRGSWRTLEETLLKMVHASLSALPLPVFDLTPYRDSDLLLYGRALELASVAPLVSEAEAPQLEENEKASLRAEMLATRRRLTPFLLAYADEVGQRGYPVLHPLPLQYPGDSEARKIADQFLLGDELLVAPLYTPENRRRVYLPMGIWTELATNRIYQGRQWIEVESTPGAVPLFLRNGSILPLENDLPGAPMILHYTPRLAAEFFLYEPDLGRYSQLHAAPAGELMRLEIDSRKTRSYQWIVHHLPEPKEITTGQIVLTRIQQADQLRPGAWYYDREGRNVHIEVAVIKDQVSVTHISFNE